MPDNPDPETSMWKREAAKFDAAGPAGYRVVAVPTRCAKSDGTLFRESHECYELRGPAGDVNAVAFGEDGRQRLTKRAAELNAASGV